MQGHRPFVWLPIIGVLAASVIFAEVGAQENAGQAGESKSEVRIFKTHGLTRQFGLSLARLTAPDIARDAILEWKYSPAKFGDADSEELLEAISAGRARVAIELEDGTLAAMDGEVAEERGLVDLSSADALRKSLAANEKIRIISGSDHLFGVANDGTVSSWNEAPADASELLQGIKGAD